MGLFGKLFGKQDSAKDPHSHSSGSTGAPDVGARTALDPTVIDLISLSPDEKSFLLHVVVGEPWDAEGRGAMQLQAKLKSYVAFAADGQLARDQPDSRGKRVVIRIDTHYPLGALEQQLVDAVRESWCKPSGIDLVVASL